MNKKELAKAVSIKLDITQKDSLLYLNAILDTIQETVKKEEVNLSGFGTFSLKETKVKNKLTPVNQNVDENKVNQKLSFHTFIKSDKV